MLPTLNVLKALTLACSWVKSSNSKPVLYSQMLSISCNLLNTILKMETEWLLGYRLVVSVSVVYLRDCVTDWELWLLLPPNITVQFSSVAQSCLTRCDPMNSKQHARPPCPSPTPGVHPDSRPSSQ